MKYFTGIFLIIGISLCSSSCQKEFTLTQPFKKSDSASFTATIDGVEFIADKAAFASNISRVIAISGQSAAGEQIMLRVADSAVHNYTLFINNKNNAGVYFKDLENPYTTNQGNDATQSGGVLSITSINTEMKTISGTFSMKVYRQDDSKQKNIAKGVFANIPYEITLPPADKVDTFMVKINGISFPAETISGNSLYGKINISASEQSYVRTVGISMPDNIAVGTYSFGTNYIGQYNVGTNNTLMMASSGMLFISEHNTVTKRIRGNFNFTAKEITGTASANFTEGFFSMEYK